MGDESEWKNLPSEEKVQHNAWRARVAGYEELIKLFQTLTDDKSPEFSKYLGLVKKFVVDSNVVAQEKGLEAALKFVENYYHAGKAASEVCGGVLSKCLNQKPKIKRLGMDILMAYIEAEKQEIVQEELMKGLTNKQPKIVTACVESLREALRDFGTKIILIKPLLKQLQTLLEDRDKAVREETKQLVIEIYKWIGAALKPQLTNLKPVQISELEAEFEKVPPSKPEQKRFLRSQQDLKAKMLERAATNVEPTQDGGLEYHSATDASAPKSEEIDAYELTEPVEILTKLPKDFYDKIEEKKWQDRKEALEALEKLASAPKLVQGDYNDVVRALLKVVAKDSNVILVALAAKCIALLATGLRDKFSRHAPECVSEVIQKFKEKKPAVVAELKNAVDACFLATNLEAISESCIAALDHKTPSVKSETASFLARCFCKCTVATLPKKLLKPFITALLKTANDTTVEVREASFEALGTAMKVVTEKAIMPFLADVDNIKMAKIKECCEKASTVGKQGTGNQVTDGNRPATAQPSAASAKSKELPKKSESAPVSASSSSTSVLGGKKKPAATTKGKKVNAPKEEVIEKELSDEAVEEKMSSLFPGDTLSMLASANWKDRVGSMEKMIEVARILAKDDIPVQAMVRTVTKKPGLKDNNFQALKMKIDLIGILAQRGNFSKRSAEYCLVDLVDKIGDSKNGGAVQECLSNVAEATSLDFVAPQVLASTFEQKNPKNQSEAINWLCKAVTQFGLKLNVKGLIETINKALASANPAVRTSGITLLGTIYMYMGPTLRVFFENEKPALLQQIDAEFEKVKDQKPPASTRGLKPSESAGTGGGDDDGVGGDDNDAAAEMNVTDLVPRTDISDKMTDALMAELADKNWKVRKEALEKVQKVISEAKFITPNLGSLPELMKQRLNDSNKILVSMTISICDQLAVSMGPSIRQHVRTIVPGLFSNFSDSKPNVRKSAVDALNKMLEQVGVMGMSSVVEGEVLLDALKTENPTQRAELFGWLAEKLPGSKKLPMEFNECILILYNNLEDRNVEVRKKANEAVLPFMIHCGFDAMLQKLSVVKPASKDVVMKALEQARPNLPAKPIKSTSAGQVSSNQQQAPVKVGVAKAAAVQSTPDVDGGNTGSCGASAPKSKTGKSAAPGTVQKKAPTVSVTSASSKKKQGEEEDISPPIRTSTDAAKEQRFKDEKNLKILKWNFDQPRKEFVDQLRPQMELHFNPTTVEQLFATADFKHHIKALEVLTKSCEESIDPTRANLDLILKWITLRFFDTNTTVLLKCLEYLILVFSKLEASGYVMDEVEALTFIPYLVNKIGDPKDNIRKDIRRIINLIRPIYPYSRISFFLLDGLKSKNAKQRTECLEELGNLIQMYGAERFQPSMSVALKTIAQQIGDRDNGVRSAALNTIVEAFFMNGERVFDIIGNLNEKDRSMLDERIKRSLKTRKPVSVQLEIPVALTKQGSPDEKSKPTKSNLTNLGNVKVPEVNRPRVRGPFDLDDSDLDANPPMPQLLDVEPNDDTPIVMPVSRYRKQSTVGLLIQRVSSTNAHTCIQALQEIEGILEDGKKASENEDINSDRSETLKGHVDDLLVACTSQLMRLHEHHVVPQSSVGVESIRLHKCVLKNLMYLCRCRQLSIEASSGVIKRLAQILITILLDPRLNLTQEGKDVSSAVNVTIVKIVENMNPDNVMAALIQLLHESIGDENSSAGFRELVMKCLWKMTRMIPNTVNQLNLDQVVGGIHSFLEAYPGHTWNKTNDMPLRTLKTILHNLIKHKGITIMDHLSLVRDPHRSEVVQYMRRVLQNMQGEFPESTFTDSVNSNSSLGSRNDQDVTPQRSPRISKAVQDSLAKIFQKIGSKENTTEGLNDLYDFKLKHPDSDLEPFLKKSSPFFQEYISNGLKNVGSLRQVHGRVPNSEPILPPPDSNLSPQGYLERLHFLRAKCGLDNSDFHVSLSKPSLSSLGSQSPRAGGDDHPDVSSPFSLSTRAANQKLLNDVTQAQGDSATNNGSNYCSNFDIDELKKRFEKIRNAKKD